jgi:hypothetical protein
MAEAPHTEHVLAFAFAAPGPCSDCVRDRNEDCTILAGAFSEWPAQWADGRCSAHWPEGQPEPVTRCPHTQELPLRPALAADGVLNLRARSQMMPPESLTPSPDSERKREPYEEWCAFAKRAGLLDENGVATDRFAAQTAWTAYTTGWNESRASLSEYAQTKPVGGDSSQRSGDGGHSARASDGAQSAQGNQEPEPLRNCEFCGCHTNAKRRACCEKGHAADGGRHG